MKILLYQIAPILKERQLNLKTRKEQTTTARLRIGHTRLTHSFVLKQEPPPKCSCGKQYTVKHILIECTNLTHIRRKFYNAKNMKKLFAKTEPKNILDFLKRIGLLSKI